MASTAPSNKKFGKSKFSALLLILFIVGLYFFQNKAVLPFVEGVVESDLFEADTSELAGKDRSRIALTQCNEFVKDDLGSDLPLQFGEESKTWELAAGRYLVSSSVTEHDEAGKQIRRNFACNVQFTGGDDMDRSNWSLQGLEMREL
jgi:hypothetical protein